MTFLLNDILEFFSNKKTYSFTLKQYQPSHSVVRLDVSELNAENVCLVFEGVEYIQFPLTWQSSGLYLASAEECVSILYKFKRGFEEIPEHYLAEQYKLYKFQHTEFEICILAHAIYLTKDS